jgi:tRNA(Ile)-lysidine synthase
MDYDYEYELPVPGTVELPSCGIRIQAVVTSGDGVPEAERARLLDPKKLRGKLHIRNWRPGDRFWPAHTRAAKKVKELLSDRHAVGAEKKLWPVAEAGGEIVWMRGFNTPEALRPAAGAREVLWIRELFAAPKNQNSS